MAATAALTAAPMHSVQAQVQKVLRCCCNGWRVYSGLGVSE
jgi:hypothetical protein